EAGIASGAPRGAQRLSRATAWTTDGRGIASTLLAGWDDRAWPGAAVPTRKPGAYRARFDLDGARDVARVRLEDLGSGDALRIDRVLLHDSGTGHTLVLGGEAQGALA